MKKFKLAMFAALSLFVLGACSSAEDLTEYTYLSFSGLDSQGTAEYGIDFDELYSKLNEEGNSNAEEELMHSGDAIDVTLDKGENLSNGDKVNLTVTVNNDDVKSFVGGETEFTVEGLEEPIEVTTEEVEKGLVVNFIGVSGRGESQIDSTLSSPLNDVNFTVENDGELKNGDKAKFLLGEDAKHHLNDLGYVLEKDFNPTVEVKDLGIVAENAEDIKNLEDIKRMIDEEVAREYKNSDSAFNYRTYETKKNNLMYRQFEEKDSDGESEDYYGNGDSGNSGSLIGVYSVKEYNDKEKTDLDSEYTAIIGFNNIILDEDNKTNVSKIEEFSEIKDDTYSQESIIQLYEGNGYTQVKEDKKKED